MTCFVTLFPEDDRSKTACLASKELSTKRYLDVEFSRIFIYNQKLFITDKDGTCTPHRRFIDFQTTIGSYVFCIEVDENQHKYYDPMDEEERIMQIYENTDRKLVFIRFNPDDYKRNGVTKKTLLKDRFPVLRDKIEEVIDRIEHGDGYSEWLTEIKLFFDDHTAIKKTKAVKAKRSTPSKQCKGTTVKGNRCKRKTKIGNYCNSHRKLVLLCKS
uniref:Endonuclease n=1 Tax=Pithovirus LCPAC404 TaxID=2506597 RepID=A0A481ZD22_9VIRU|nr:MAG: endonuclease [Pithovirus LCPAC404]